MGTTAADVRPGQTVTVTVTVRDVMHVIFGSKIQLASDGALLLLEPSHEVAVSR